MEFGQLPSGQKGPLTQLFFFLTRLGQEAVLTFFVLSGALVAGQLIARVRTGQFDLARYGIDRATRILLPLVPACVLTECVNVVAFHDHLQLPIVLGNMFGLNGLLVPVLARNPPLWTLSYEIWFYVIGGLAGLLLTQGSRVWVIVGLCLCCVVFSQLDARYLLYWWLGGLATLVIVSRLGAASLAAVGIVLSLAGAIVFELGFASRSFTNVTYLPQPVSQAIFCGGICLILPLLRSKELFSRIGTFAAAFSGFSYTLYLFHYPTNAMLSLLLPRASSLSAFSIGLFLLRIAVCIGVAWFMYLLFERHTAGAREFLYGKVGARRAPAPAGGALFGLQKTRVGA